MSVPESNRITLAERFQGVDLGPVNARLASAHPRDVVAWALARAVRPMVTTSFGLHSAAMLHLVARQRPDVSVVWIDTGFNTADTYRHADMLARSLRLDLRVYAPDLTRARVEASMGGVPPAEAADEHAAFSLDIKLKPFERALSEIRPDVWFTGIRADETDWRRQLDIVTREKNGELKVAPFFRLSESDVEAYMRQNSLPFGDPLHYDPVKARPHRECGLHGPCAPV